MTDYSNFQDFTSDLVAVLVTYGDRVQLVSGALSSAREAGVSRVIIVANGCSPSVVERLRRVASTKGPDDFQVEVVPRNLGSAGGFARGLEKALNSQAGRIWLLDDDSEVTMHAVEALWRGAVKFPDAVLASRRSVNPLQTRALRLGSRAYPPSGSFLYFDLVERVARSWLAGQVQHWETPCYVEIPYGPYGGLLLTPEHVGTTGLPDQRLGLYEDDTEYTSRLEANNIRYIMCVESVIDDADAKWSEGPVTRRLGPARLLLSTNRTRLFMSVRNRTTFDRKRASGSVTTVFRFWVNLTSYLALTTFIAARLVRLRSLHTVYAGVLASYIRPYEWCFDEKDLVIT